MFSSKTAKTTVRNQQVGVQGAGAVGNSGSIGAGALGGNYQRIGAGDRSVINVQTSDLGAINAAATTQLAALSANQTVSTASIGAQRDVSLQAINFANANTSQALEIVRGSNERASNIAEYAVAAAQQTALQATPVSPGAYAEAIGGDTKTKIIIAAISAGAILLAVYIYKKS